MEFDKSRVYTALNADELKVGSKVVVANSLGVLKEKFNQEDATTRLLGIKSEQTANRFEVDKGLYLLAYLVEEPTKLKLKWTDLKVGDVLKTGNKMIAMVTAIDFNSDDFHIRVGGQWVTDTQLERLVKEE